MNVLIDMKYDVLSSYPLRAYNDRTGPLAGKKRAYAVVHAGEND